MEDIQITIPPLNRLTIKAGYTTLSIYKGEYNEEYHSIVLYVCESGQFDTISVWKVTKFEQRHIDELKTRFPNLTIITDNPNDNPQQ